MTRIITTLISVIFISLPAYAGWVSPNPPELIINQTVDIQSGGVTNILVDFNERSTYTVGLALDPKVDFHSSQGKSIHWGESFSLEIEIVSNGKSHFKHLTTLQLDKTLGYDFATLSVPANIPKGEHTLTINFVEVGQKFSKVYSGGRVLVSKHPLIRILD